MIIVHACHNAKTSAFFFFMQNQAGATPTSRRTKTFTKDFKGILLMMQHIRTDKKDDPIGNQSQAQYWIGLRHWLSNETPAKKRKRLQAAAASAAGSEFRSPSIGGEDGDGDTE